MRYQSLPDHESEMLDVVVKVVQLFVPEQQPVIANHLYELIYNCEGNFPKFVLEVKAFLEKTAGAA